MAIFKEIAKADGSGIVEYHRIQNGMIVNMDYNKIANKPTINGVELIGDLKSEDLKIEGGGTSGKGLNIIAIDDLGISSFDDVLEDGGYFVNKVITKPMSEFEDKKELVSTADGICVEYNNLLDESQYHKFTFLKQGNNGYSVENTAYYEDKRISLVEAEDLLSNIDEQYEIIANEQGYTAANEYRAQEYSKIFVSIEDFTFTCVDISNATNVGKVAPVIRTIQFSICMNYNDFATNATEYELQVKIYCNNKFIETPETIFNTGSTTPGAYAHEYYEDDNYSMNYLIISDPIASAFFTGAWETYLNGESVKVKGKFTFNEGFLDANSDPEAGETVSYNLEFTPIIVKDAMDEDSEEEVHFVCSVSRLSKYYAKEVHHSFTATMEGGMWMLTCITPGFHLIMA